MFGPMTTEGRIVQFAVSRCLDRDGENANEVETFKSNFAAFTKDANTETLKVIQSALQKDRALTEMVDALDNEQVPENYDQVESAFSFLNDTIAQELENRG